MAVAGLALLVAGFYVGYRLNVSDTLAARVQMWQSPWDNAVRGGDQVAQSIWALSTGGLFGTGLGFGDTRYLPAGHTDLVFAAVGEELGAVGLLAIAAVYAVIAARGFRIGLAAASDYGFFLATAVTLFLVVPVLIMAAGVLGVIPLTGVVTPFLSYGGSAMAANFAALGMLTAIQRNPSSDRAAPFRTPTRYLRGALGAAALGLMVALAYRAGPPGGRLRRQAPPRSAGRRRAAIPVQPARARRHQGDPARHRLRSARSAAGDGRRGCRARGRGTSTTSWA